MHGSRAGAQVRLPAIVDRRQFDQRVGTGGAPVAVVVVDVVTVNLDADDLATLGEGPFQSVVAVVTFEVGQAPILELRPARIDVAENRPRPATPPEAAAILELLQP